jgi:carbamoyl-phosphate synthase small subunit
VSEAELVQHPDLLLSHINLNDNTVEGLRLKNGRGFSVQYHPESSPGPHDSRYLFEDFRKLLQGQTLST